MYAKQTRGDGEYNMVLQIFTDPWQVNFNSYSNLVQNTLASDARMLEDSRTT